MAAEMPVPDEGYALRCGTCDAAVPPGAHSCPCCGAPVAVPAAGGSLSLALARTREYAERLVEEAGVPIVVLDTTGKVRTFNRAAERLTDTPRDEILGHPFLDHFVPGDRFPKGRAAIERLLEEPVAGGGMVEAPLLDADGRERQVLWHTGLLVGTEGEPLRAFFGRDVTEERLTREALDKAHELRDLFLDILRHDLLNPLASIRGITVLALEGENDPERREMLETVLRSSKRMLTIIENASVLARLEAGGELPKELRDLGLLLRGAAEDLKLLADPRRMTLVVSAPGDYPAVVSLLVADVFSNLLGNAVKYGRPGTEVRAEIVDGDDCWRVRVANLGDPVPDEAKEAIFHRFNRLADGRQKGLGLGLAIVRAVVERHGGRVRIEDHPDGGSIFTVELAKAPHGLPADATT